MGTALDPDAYFRVLLRDVDSRASAVNQFHHAPDPSFRRPCEWSKMGGCVFQGGRTKQDSDARSHWHNPRFPRTTAVPSTTKLAHRLTGTTDAAGLDWNTPLKCPSPEQTAPCISIHEPCSRPRTAIFSAHGGATLTRKLARKLTWVTTAIGRGGQNRVCQINGCFYVRQPARLATISG